MSAVAEPLAAEPPILHTVEEAAGLLRIGRTLAYSLARRYEDSGGRDGLPVVRLGNCLRVPRSALMELANRGRVAPLSNLENALPHDHLDDAARSTDRALRLVDMCDDDTQPDHCEDGAVEQLAIRFPQD